MKTKINFLKKYNYFLNQNGIGLIPAVMAAGLVVIMALSVSYFVTKQRQVSAQIDNSSDCQQTVKSVTDFLTKDNNALFITSIGPRDINLTPGQLETFPTNFVTQDGLPQFPTGMAANVGVNSAINAPPPPNPSSFNFTDAAILPNWDFRNSLNIRNTINRMAALAMANPTACCNNLDTMSANRPGNLACGIPFNPPGVDFGRGQVIIGVNFSDSLGNNYCPNPARVPTSRNNATAKIRVQVFIDPTAANPRSCSGDATAHFPEDQVTPIVLLDIPNAGMCADGAPGSPYTCNPAATTFSFTASTVRNRNAQSCEQCLQNNLNSNQCPGPQNPAAVCGAACVGADPGSLFLCRIGEKHWFDMNPNHWEPCERTAVYGCSGGQWLADNGLAGNPSQTCNGREVLGRVNINYLDNAALPNFPTQTSTTTRATITLSNLTEARAYEIDVRAVDTKGNFAGRSFVGVVSRGANGSAYLNGPQFVIPSQPPVLGPLSEGSNIVDPAGLGLAGAQAVSNPAAFTPMAGQYQCAAGNPNFAASIEGYTGMPPHVYPLLFGETCTLNASGPGAINGSCGCAFGVCSGTIPGVGTPGTWTARMQVSSKCGQLGNDPTFSWCYENAANPNTSISVGNTASDTPSLSLTRPAGKLCDLSVGLGNVIPALINYRLFNGNLNEPFTTMGWNPLLHSGCQPGWFIYPQVCSTVTDVCGRQSRPRMDYSSRLTVGDAATNSCEFVGYNTDGNDCINGAYCKKNFKCESRTNHPWAGQNCYASESGSVPYNDINHPCAHATDCKFGQVGYISGNCQGAQYECVSAAPAATQLNCSSGPVAGRACEINNACEDVERICYNSDDSPRVPRMECMGGSDCWAGPIPDGRYCGVELNSGNCDITGTPCTDSSDCAVINGTCQVRTPGVCQAPTNLHCDECPQSGSRLMCPLIDGGCDLMPTPPFPTLTCGGPPPPPPPACGACVRGDEVDRTACLDAGGNPAPLGQPGTITITYGGCRCDVSGAPCVGCATTETRACTGTNFVGKWCPIGRTNACVATEINPASSCFVDGQEGASNLPGCNSLPIAYMSTDYRCVRQDLPCPPPPAEQGRWCHVGDDQRCVSPAANRTEGGTCNPATERLAFENRAGCEGSPVALLGKELMCIETSLPCPPYGGLPANGRWEQFVNDLETTACPTDTSPNPAVGSSCSPRGSTRNTCLNWQLGPPAGCGRCVLFQCE